MWTDRLKRYSDKIPICIFIIKCAIGIWICHRIYLAWPNYPFDWAMISVALSTSLDNSNKHAVDRILSNVLGCSVGLMLFAIPGPYVLLLLMGVTATVALGYSFKLTGTIRAALAALVIVMLREEESKAWFVALERVLCVMTGCIVALLLTFVFQPFVPDNPGSDKDSEF